MRDLARVACLLIACTWSTTAAAAEHDWRFETLPGFLADSQGSATLSTAGGGATQLALPASGRGSTFSSAPSASVSAADFNGASTMSAWLSDAPTDDFTVELYAHFDAFAGSYGEHIAGTALNRFNANIGWSLQYRFGTTTLQMIPCTASSCELVDSGITLETGKDYYIAVTLDIVGAAGGNVVFYVENLTDGTGLQTVSRPHSVASYNPISTFAIGGAADSDMAVNGLIDEVRLHNRVLGPEEIQGSSSAVPALSGSGLLILALAIFGSAMMFQAKTQPIITPPADGGSRG